MRIARKILAFYLLAIIVSLFIAGSHPVRAQQEAPVKDKQIKIYVTVGTKDNQVVTELKQENFSVYEGKVLKPITFFSSREEAASVGFLIDTSGSMQYKTRIPIVQMLSRFTSEANSENEYFALTFAKTVNLTPLSKDSHAVLDGLDSLLAADPLGETKLFDAVRLGLDSLQNAKNDKKALVVLTDLQENDSKIKFDQLKWMVRESGVLLYFLVVISKEYPPFLPTGYRLTELASMSGGNSFFLYNFEEIRNALTLIRLNLKHQYTIGFESTYSSKKDRDEWRKIDIKIQAPKNFKKLIVNRREGYFALRQQ